MDVGRDAFKRQPYILDRDPRLPFERHGPAIWLERTRRYAGFERIAKRKWTTSMTRHRRKASFGGVIRPLAAPMFPTIE